MPLPRKDDKLTKLTQSEKLINHYKKQVEIRDKHLEKTNNNVSDKIDITPNWITCGEIIIMALQNPNLDHKGFENVFANIRDMAKKMDHANKIIKQLKSEKG